MVQREKKSRAFWGRPAPVKGEDAGRSRVDRYLALLMVLYNLLLLLAAIASVIG
ncbi:MAG: hypothetical protein PVH19_14825 [Planctomycetia bacterium]|jgi:hypothetical protein